MNKLKVVAAALLLACAGSAMADPLPQPDIKDILKSAGGAVSNMVEGVLTKSDLTVEDICGEWTANGSAVTFKSDNMLKKAGGMAAAGAVESQLNEYYKKYGLNNVVFTVNPDSTFSLAWKKVSLKGTITVKSKGIFTMKFTAFGGIGLGSMDAYIEKSMSNLNLMFDADKIKSLISLAANLSGSKLVSTADSFLKQYDGICMGFKMKQTAKSESTSATPGTTTTTTTTTKTESTGLDALKNLFKK